MIRPIITLTTDFGAGTYVAEMKAIILQALPDAIVVDIAHDIAPQSLVAAEVALRRCAWAFPETTVHVVVVDPGVGTARRGIAARCAGRYFVGPDNGVLSIATTHPEGRAVVLDNRALHRQPVSPTFHGRDIFAPVAAELAGGLTLADVGSPATELCGSNIAPPLVEDACVRGVVIDADHFGNLTTNIPATLLSRDMRITVGGHPARWVKTYGDAPKGLLLALIGSDGYLEIASNGGSAAAFVGSMRGAEEIRCEMNEET